MKRRKQSLKARIIGKGPLGFTCPQCKANSGSRCKTLGGREMMMLHAPRLVCVAETLHSKL